MLTLIVIIATVDRLGIDTTSPIALLDTAGIAAGLALKDSLGNFIPRITLILSRPFRTGDYVEVAGIVGSVEKISLFTAALFTPDNREITAPNAAIYADTITNWRTQIPHVDMPTYSRLVMISSWYGRPSNRVIS